VTLAAQVQSDITTAMKAGDRERVGALRLVLSELQKAAKDGDGDELAVLRRERKRRLESATAYRDAGREDLAGPEEAEAALIEAYLPQQMADAELAELVERAVAESGASEAKDMGRVIKLVMAGADGRADGRRVSTAVKDRLGA